MQSKVGEALEALGEFDKAARLYLDASKMDINLEHATGFIEYAGLAYKRDGDLEKAEKHYLHALHLRQRQAEGGKLDLTEGGTMCLLNNTIILFESMCLRKGSRAGMVEDEFYFVFLGLLSIAGFRAKSDCVDAFNSYASCIIPIIREDIRSNPRKALDILSVAAMKPEKAYFYSVLIRCIPPGISLDVQVFGTGDKDKRRRTAIGNAQEYVTSSGAPTVDAEILFCGFPGCTCKKAGNSTEMMMCPCKSISYCGKSCQVSHWHEHKKFCRVRAKRIKAKQAQSK